MAMNVPIIMGVRGQARQIVVEPGGGIAMTPEDEDSLIAGIDAINSNREAYRQGRRYVAEYFDRDVLARKMLDELTALVDGSTASDRETPSALRLPNIEIPVDRRETERIAA
jgi:glycosyltransferase involved in cell wall biosynthesis